MIPRRGDATQRSPPPGDNTQPATKEALLDLLKKMFHSAMKKAKREPCDAWREHEQMRTTCLVENSARSWKHGWNGPLHQPD